MAVTIFLITFSGALFCESRLRVKSQGLGRKNNHYKTKQNKTKQNKSSSEKRMLSAAIIFAISLVFVSHNRNDDVQWKILVG